MTPNSTEQKLEIKSYSIATHQIAIYQNPEVWLPYSATKMLEFLIQKKYIINLKDKAVLDLGTGSGIIGIVCALEGATELVLSDYCDTAVWTALQNAELNQVRASGVQSDRFESFAGCNFDLIISNPPVQPWLFTDLAHQDQRINSAAWNEAGNDGRLVLDALICESKKYLKPQGTVITSSSSRHGHRQTLALLDQYWGINWEEIYVSEHAIDPNYHQPYMELWKNLQSQDFDLRVYQKDGEGRKFAIQKDNKRALYLLMDFEIEGKNIPVKIFRELDTYQVINLKQEKILDLSLEDSRLPDLTTDYPWYYTYHLFRMQL